MECTETRKKQLLKGAFVALSLLLGIIGVNDIVVHYHSTPSCPPKVCNLTEPLTNINTTECSYLKQFRLSNGKRLTVCKYKGSLRIDIRQFINTKTTIQGIWLRSSEWKNLLNQLPDIMVALIESKSL